MPVSVVCEPTSNVDAALRETLGVSGFDDWNGKDGFESIQSKLAASAKRVLISKIDYEEVDNYNQAVLDALKSKYVVLKPGAGGGTVQNADSLRAMAAVKTSAGMTNGHHGPNGGGPDKHCSNGHGSTNGNGASTPTNATLGGGGVGKRANPNELPMPKRILYPRDQVRIGWKGGASAIRKWQIGVGMMNVGNTCYLNSTLQALFHVPSMAHWLLSDTAHMERCESADSTCIICAMAKTLQASQSSQSSIRPYYVYSKLKYICKHLVMGRQEDAHEFLRYLVEAMEKSYLSRFSKSKDLDQYSKETTPLNQILGGYLKSAVRCLACNHVSVTFQHFQDLLLDIRKVDTIEEALESYFARERLEDMGYKCEACKRKVSATKQFSLERAPIALCIQLKRFSVVGTKLSKQISLKTRLDLTRFISRKTPGEQLTYKLVSMVTHLGSSQHCGHYTAIGLTESGTYYNYDDSYVRPITVQNVCNTNAYIIFYEMECSPPRLTSACGSSSAAAEAKESTSQKAAASNGFVVGSERRVSPQRLIGPQLPPSGLNNHYGPTLNGATKALTNGGGAYGSKLSTNCQHAVPSSSHNSKIMIHFKNNNNGAQPPSPTAPQNGGHTPTLPNGGGKFSDGGMPHKRQTAGGHQRSSSSSESSDDEGARNGSSKRLERKAPSANISLKSSLPSMPKLFDHYQTSLTNGAGKKPYTNSASAPTTPSPPALKSLVPYGYESEEEEGELRRLKSAPPSCQNLNAKVALKRANSEDNDSSSSSDSSDGEVKRPKKSSPHQQQSHEPASNGSAAQSKVKAKTDAIDEIFNTTSRASGGGGGGGGNSPTKKQKMLTSATMSDSEDRRHSSRYDAAGQQRHTSPGGKRAQSTPPSPPVIKTKTGLWQVTQLNANGDEEGAAGVAKPTKNPNNPFASRAATTEPSIQKRPKSEKRNHAGNGYQSEVTQNGGGGASELLRQSHRGYGAPVSTWNGEQTDIEKEVLAEAREQRQRDWEEEEETEMDRGRQKKVKAPAQRAARTPGYNPFQELEGSHRRWTYGTTRYHGGSSFRHPFQRNKFKFQRFNSKHHRFQTRGGMGSGGVGGGSNKSTYNRRNGDS